MESWLWESVFWRFWFMDIRLLGSSDLSWGSVTFFIHRMSLKPYLEGLLSKYVTLMKDDLANLKIFPVQINGMEGSYKCEEFYLSPKIQLYQLMVVEMCPRRGSCIKRCGISIIWVSGMVNLWEELVTWCIRLH